MRDRLIELVSKAREKCGSMSCLDCKYKDNEAQTTRCCSYLIVDCLLENGVIVLPCKVGDTVYYLGGIHRRLIKSATVVEIILNSDGVRGLFVNSEDGVSFENSLDTFLLTKEEAEQALKGEQNNG